MAGAKTSERRLKDGGNPVLNISSFGVGVNRKKAIIILLLILTIAVFFRFWKLSEIPPGFYHDVAMNGIDALNALETKNFKLFYPENNGREGLFINLIALSFLIFGPSILAIKIVPAIIGAFTVWGLFLFSKELFRERNNGTIIALLSTFFLATSFWHNNFSRFGFRAIMVPFCLVFSFYFFLKGVRTQKLMNFIFSGIFFGLGFHTYISFRLAVLILIVPLWFYCTKFCRDYRNSLKFRETYFKMGYYKFDVWLLTIFLVALPMGLYFLSNPQDFVSRATGISIFAQKNPILSFLESLIKHLGMFNFYGDPNWRHNFSGSPELPWPLGILFLVGFVLVIKELSSKKERSQFLIFGDWLLIVWFFAMLLPGILTAEGLPHSLRVIGAIPPVYIFSGLGCWKAYEWLRSKAKNKKLLLFACCLFLFATGYAEYDKYFVNWANHPATSAEFTKKNVDIGLYLNSLPDDVKKFVIVNESGVPMPWPNGLPLPAQTPIFIERTVFGKSRTTYLKENDINKIGVSENTVIIPMKFDEKIFKKLKELYPDGETKNENGIWLYKIKSK